MSKSPKHKRRTEDEMHKALTIIEAHKSVLHVNHDDEHVDVLCDAVSELLATRAILTRLMQDGGSAFQVATLSIKGMMQ